MEPAQAEPEVTSKLYGYVAHIFMPSFLTSSSHSAHSHDHMKDLLQPANQGRKAWLGSRWVSLACDYKSKMGSRCNTLNEGVSYKTVVRENPPNVQPLGQCTWSSTFCEKTSGLRKKFSGLPLPLLRNISLFSWITCFDSNQMSILPFCVLWLEIYNKLHLHLFEGFMKKS